MSVVSARARRRWALVAAGAILVAAVPAAVPEAWGRLTGGRPAAPASGPGLVRQALASASVAHSGLARSTGSLGLPRLPRLEDVAAQLGSATSVRVWWAGPAAWRVDVLSSTGETDTYGSATGLTTWDYEGFRLTGVTGEARLRLPRPDDELPPQLARRLLAGLGPADRVSALPGTRRIAGVTAAGLRVVPADPRASIGHLDVWVEPRHGLPVAVTVADTRGTAALDSRFLELDLRPPGEQLLEPPAAPGAERDAVTETDLLARLERRRRQPLPATLAGLPATEPLVPGVGTFGSGLARLTVVPIAPGLAEQSLAAVREGGGAPIRTPGGETLLASRGVLALAVARSTDGARAYLISGTVRAPAVLSAARELLAAVPRAAQP